MATDYSFMHCTHEHNERLFLPRLSCHVSLRCVDKQPHFPVDTEEL